MTLFDRMRRLLGSSHKPSHQSHEGDGICEACRDVSCMEAMEKVQEYLDGELDGVSHGEVAHHFSICKRCFPHLKLEERFRELLVRSQEGETCPEHLREQVLELLAAEVAKPR